MIDSRDSYEPTDEPSEGIEAVIRAAGQYVGASEGLRPRVLETARAECGEQRAQRCIRRVAAFVMLSAILTMSSGRGLDSAGAPQRFGLIADADSIFLRAESGGGDWGWAMVEAFTELRHQQAEALRLSP